MRSYLAGFSTAFGCVLASALVLGLVDLAHTGGGAAPIPAILGLWALLALPLALGAGLVLGAGNATWGEGFIRGALRRLRDDRTLDQTIAGALIAGALVGGVLALAVSKLVGPLVLSVQRQNVGALLLGVATVALVPILALGAIPLYRITRIVARAIPAAGPLSRVMMLLVLAAAGLAASALFIIYRQLDAQALKLGFFFSLAMLPVLALALGILFHGPLARVRAKIPRLVVLGGAVVAIALPIVGLTGTPSDAVQTAVTDHSYLGSVAIEKLREHIDHDGDGYSAFFGGPDCDDNDAMVNPGMPEICGNGKDDNCIGGDAPCEPDAPKDAGTAPVTPDAPTVKGGDNVLIIFVDTLRYDHLGFTGYQREGASLTPRIDGLAKQSIVFSRAWSQAPNTPRSVPSFMTSRYPSQVHFDKQFKSYAKVLDDNDLLFESMKAAGFNTFAETSHFYFCTKKRPKDCDYGNPKDANIDQGVDVWDNSDAVDISPSNHDIAGPRIAKKAIAKLDELAAGKQKFAMLVHLFDPHSTYMEHPGFTYKRGKDALMERYDYEVAFDDKLIGDILDELDKTGLAANTAVVLMADHGEAFGEHVVYGEADYFHGDTLYAELTHVPLMFRVPGLAPCMRDDVVQLVDMAPTVAALSGVPPAPTWVGRSLVPAMTCGKPSALPAQPAFAELLPEPMWDHDAKAMVTADGKRHVYYRKSDNRWEIYDLEADPAEAKNIADGDPDAAKLEAALAHWIEGPLEAGKTKKAK